LELLCAPDIFAALAVCGTTWDLCAPEYFVALVVYRTTWDLSVVPNILQV